MKYLLVLGLLFNAHISYAQKCSDKCEDQAAEAAVQRKPKKANKPDDPFRSLLRPKEDTRIPKLPRKLPPAK